MKSLAEIKAAGSTITGLGVLADVGTLISPQDSGALRQADRGAALLNGTLLTLNATTDWIPYWGEAVIIVTGAYLAGDYLDNHFPLFREVTTEISGAGLSSADLPDSVALAEHEMDAVHGVEHAADETGHAIREGWHTVTSSITSSIGRWF